MDDPSSTSIQLHAAAANLQAGPASPVVSNDMIHKGKFFMVIRLGTPPVFNLVTIDTGSILSWVQCQPCQIWCYTHNPEAGPTFDPLNSTTYQRVACSSQDCTGIQERLGVQFGCMEEMETCLYSFRYGSGPMAQYSVGRLSKDRLGLTLSDDVVVDDFIFGCSEDARFKGSEAGIVGFGNDRFSFLNQVMDRQTNSYHAVSYCFPAGDGHDARGFLSMGPAFVYSLQQLDMMVDGQRLEAVTAAMAAKGYGRHQLNDQEHTVCFRVTGSDTAVDWNDLPKVEMKFTGTTLKLPPQNPRDAGVNGVQILGNKATRSIRVVFHLRAKMFGFEPDAC
ncbi:hypothetical protein PR202_ga03895 [Eleusine coracana subsp. coracana]|uniref:Peptidase A1 domain-containing protein n=1 Tax=Eleusine coracana subsp. coracana TaxID=191504 RepID=A0AAV5BQ74_ELECO|nr:hypothetical protein PR202_ga03895 [Eleusine coracana subsp. coracana]